MAENENYEPTPAEETPVSEERVAASDTDRPAVSAQEAKLVGNDELPAPREVTVDVVKEQVDAQVVQPREPDADKVNVHEVSVQLDEVITDPSSPLAVQVPDEGRGFLSLPIQGLDAPRPEDVFDASREDES